MQENPAIKNVSIFPCKNCGANLIFDPARQMLACEYCGSTKPIETKSQITKHSYQQFLNPASESLQQMAEYAMQASCQNCGATVVFTPPETARDCDFCGSKIVAQEKSADPIIAPEGILPLKIPRAVALRSLSNWLSSRWFAPSALRKFARSEKLHSIYIPYWNYDSFTSSYYEGERGEHYWEEESYFENGERKTRSVMKTRWYHASGQVQRQFTDFSVPATKSLPRHYIEKLEPWDLENLVSFDPAFLAGHRAQTYQVVLPEGFERFKEIAYKTIYEDACRDIGGDEQRVEDISTEYSETKFSHLLLPLYAGAYDFKGKIYQIVLNGRTGEIHGARPFSWVKIGLLVFAIIILLLILLSIFGR